MWLQNFSLPKVGCISNVFANLFSISFLNLSANNIRISNTLHATEIIAEKMQR
jgi:hypothetical protein